MATKQQKVTIYTSGMLGVQKYEGRLVGHGTEQYAQYDNAAYVHFIPKRKRKVRVVRGTYKPYILVLEGHGHPDLSTWKMGKSSTPGITVMESKYSACDDRWETDADVVLDNHIEKHAPTVIADYRHTKGFNANDRYANR